MKDVYLLGKENDFDLLLKENKRKATKKLIMWMIILVVFATFVIVGSIITFDNLAKVSIDALK